MKQCGECFAFSPNDANFCIECSNAFATTGATERLQMPNGTPPSFLVGTVCTPMSSMGCNVAHLLLSSGNISSSGSWVVPLMPDVFEVYLGDGSERCVIIVDHKRGY